MAGRWQSRCMTLRAIEPVTCSGRRLAGHRCNATIVGVEKTRDAPRHSELLNRVLWSIPDLANAGVIIAVHPSTSMQLVIQSNSYTHGNLAVVGAAMHHCARRTLQNAAGFAHSSPCLAVMRLCPAQDLHIYRKWAWTCFFGRTRWRRALRLERR